MRSDDNGNAARFVLDQHGQLVLNSVRALKQQSDRYVIPHGHINLIASQPVFALTLKYYVLYGEAANIPYIVIGLTRPEFILPFPKRAR